MAFKHVMLVGCLLSIAVQARAATWSPDATFGNPTSHERLYDIGRRYAESHFDPDANMVGYRERKQHDKWVHETRESAYYAYGLLISGDPGDRARAQAVLRKVIATQDAQAGSATLGVYKSSPEDQWVAGKNVDRNSAAFIGAALADVIDLDHRHAVLDADVRSLVERSTRLAVEEVMKRDVTPGYTNIAILCSALASAGEKFLAVPGAGRFAQAKLDAVIDRTGDGTFCEYLSPTYSGVDLMGGYFAKKFAFSGAYAAAADRLVDHLWSDVAAAYHAPTCQLAGPFSRTYGENMLAYAAFLKYFLYLGLDGQYPMPDTETEHDGDKGALLCIADLPVAARIEFKSPIEPWRQFTSLALNGTSVRHLFQYRAGSFVLSSIADQDEFKQRANLVAYWPRNSSGRTGLQLGYCLDESGATLPDAYDWQSVHFVSVQKKEIALVAIVTPLECPTGGGLSLIFDRSATVEPVSDSTAALRISYGSIDTYLYPVTNNNTEFARKISDDRLRVVRPWKSSDRVGTKRVLAYLAVFRPTSSVAPRVSDRYLGSNKDGLSASAVCDGVKLSVSF